MLTEADMRSAARGEARDEAEYNASMFQTPPPLEHLQQPCRTCQQIDEQIALIEDDEEGRQVSAAPLTFRVGTSLSLRQRAQSCSSCHSILAFFPESFTDEIYLKLAIQQPRVRIECRGYFVDFMSPRALRSDEEIGRLYDPVHIDVNLIKSWVHCCDATHRGNCQIASGLLSADAHPILPSLNLIDLELECVVTLTRSPNPRYVALSYVWGTVETTKASIHNIGELRQPQSLSIQNGRFIIPNTIRDAMNIALSIGEKYLWVDCLCIIQDDEDNRELHLNSMASIYAKASFTIVASQGRDANTGLAGVGKNAHLSRARYQAIKFPSTTLTRYVRRKYRFDTSDWGYRGWTFQEHLFSRRLLTLNGPNGLASWTCKYDMWVEEIQRPTEQIDWVETYGDIAYSTSSHIPETSRLPLWPDLFTYGQIVSNYSSRVLTFEDDILDAFRGVITAITPLFPGGFHYGLPEAFLDLALLWQPTDGVRRRLSRNGNNVFPSWSWIGWVGEVSFSLSDASIDWVHNEQRHILLHPCVAYSKRRRSDGHIKRLASVFSHRGLEGQAAPTQQHPQGWTQHRTSAKVYYTHAGAEGRQFYYPIPLEHSYGDRRPEQYYPHLIFNAMRGWFTMGRTEEREEWNPSPNQHTHISKEVELLDDEGLWAGILLINEEMAGNALESETERCELIAISSGSTFDRGDGMEINSSILGEYFHPDRPIVSEFYDFYHVLWIEWSEGVAYRKALGRVICSTWESKHREIIEVVLG